MPRLTLLSIFGSVKYVGKHSAACSPTAAVVAGAGGALALPAVPPFPIGPASAEDQAMGGRQRTKNDVRKDKKVRFALEDRRNVAAAVVAVPRQGYSSNKCCGGEEEANTQHKCCGNKSCNNHVDPLAPSLLHVSLRKFFAPATLQQPCARLCVSRPARAMPKSPPERPNQWEQGSCQQQPPPWPAADAAGFPPLAPSRNVRNPTPKAFAKPMGPYNVFVPRAPLPKEPPPLGRLQVARGESVSADSTGTLYSDVEWRASVVECGTVRSDVNDGPGMGSANSSLTAAECRQ